MIQRRESGFFGAGHFPLIGICVFAARQNRRKQVEDFAPESVTED